MEIGPRDLDKNQVVLVRRDTREKRPASLDTLGEDVAELLSRIQADMLIAARERREQHSIREPITYDRFRELMEGEGGFVYAGWCGDAACEAADQGRHQGDDPGAPGRGIPIGGRADDLPPVRASGQHRGGMGQGVLTAGFPRVDGTLLAEGVPLARIAERRRHAGVRVQRGVDA